jgi:hypothetical protein
MTKRSRNCARLPAWDEAVARLARVELDAKAPARKDYELLTTRPRTAT